MPESKHAAFETCFSWVTWKSRHGWTGLWMWMNNPLSYLKVPLSKNINTTSLFFLWRLKKKNPHADSTRRQSPLMKVTPSQQQKPTPNKFSKKWSNKEPPSSKRPLYHGLGSIIQWWAPNSYWIACSTVCLSRVITSLARKMRYWLTYFWALCFIPSPHDLPFLHSNPFSQPS